jgi:hypothetical protein
MSELDRFLKDYEELRDILAYKKLLSPITNVSLTKQEEDMLKELNQTLDKLLKPNVSQEQEEFLEVLDRAKNILGKEVLTTLNVVKKILVEIK